MDNGSDWGYSTFDSGNLVRALTGSSIVLILFLCFFAASGSSELYINSSQTVFEQNASFDVLYSADTRENYTLNVTDGSANLIYKQNMRKLNSSKNGSKPLLYGVNYTTGRSHGSRTARVFFRDSNRTVSSGKEEFYVVGDNPEIMEYGISPPIRFVNQNLTARVKIADSMENVGTSEITIGNRKLSLYGQNESSENVQVFSRDFNMTEIGKYTYQIDIVDSNGFSDSVSDSFLVESGPSQSHTNVSVSVDNECLNLTTTLSAPGNEPINVITRNTTGSFLGEFFNSGSIPHQAIAEIDVTFEGNDSWDEGEKKGRVVLSYNSKNFSIPANGRGEYYRRFDAVYEPGNYTGRMSVSTKCFDQEENKTLAHNFTLTDNFKIVDVSGEDSLLQNGSQTTNQSIPADASRRGAESDQTLEGDNPEPGSTVRPQPEPRPSLSLNMETLNATYSTGKNTYREIGLRVRNFADTALQQIQITPQVNQVEGDWSARSATIAQMVSQQRINTSVFLQPTENVPPGNYRVPVMARLISGRSLDVEYINIQVTEQVRRSNLTIVESPQVLTLQRNSSTQIPILLKNSGNRILENVSIEVQNLESCGTTDSSKTVQIPVNETASQKVFFKAGSEIRTCEGLIIASSKSGVYAFANIRIEVAPEEGFIPRQFRVPLIASLWTVLLLVYALVTRRFQMNSYMVKIPFLLLIVGETVIFLYLAANYYGLVPGQLLPF